MSLAALTAELLDACPEGNAAVSALNAAMAVELAGRLSTAGVPARWAGLPEAEAAAEAAGTAMGTLGLVPEGHARRPLPEAGSRGELVAFATEEAAKASADAWAVRVSGGLIDRAPGFRAGPEDAVLIAAAAFRGTWETPFSPTATKPAPFLAPAGEVQVPMMRRLGTMGYAAGDGWQAVSLPYAGGMTFLGLVRQDGAVDMAALLGLLDGDAFRYPRVMLALPRFSADTRLDLMRTSIGSEASLLGLERATLYGAGLTGARHACQVRTDEEGTVATATTVLEFRCASMMPEKPPVPVSFDRPFAFVLAAGSVPVFAGRVTEPERA